MVNAAGTVAAGGTASAGALLAKVDHASLGAFGITGVSSATLDFTGYALSLGAWARPPLTAA